MTDLITEARRVAAEAGWRSDMENAPRDGCLISNPGVGMNVRIGRYIPPQDRHPNMPDWPDWWCTGGMTAGGFFSGMRPTIWQHLPSSDPSVPDPHAALLLRVEALEQGLRGVITIPAVLQALGTNHTNGCDCPLCKARALLGDSNDHLQPEKTDEL